MMRVTSWLLRPGLLKRLLASARLGVRLLRDPRVRWPTKLVPLFALVYLISPIDLAPDLLPVAGQLDDLAVAIAALELFIKLSPLGPVAHHQSAIGRGQRYSPMSPADDIIEAEWRQER
jgi:uncharacterized membrane protein YkvA (DUF1232 family)